MSRETFFVGHKVKNRSGSLTFPSVTPQTAASLSWTYGCPLASSLPLHFSLWQPQCATTTRCSHSLPGSCIWTEWFTPGVPHWLISAAQSSSDSGPGCQEQLCNRMFHCWRKQGSDQPLTLHILKRSQQLPVDLTGPTCHVDLSKPGMCARVFSFKGSSAVVEVTVVLDFPDPAAQPLLLFFPGRGPSIHGKGTTLFQMSVSWSGEVTITNINSHSYRRQPPSPPANAVFAVTVCRNFLRNHDAVLWKVTAPHWQWKLLAFF